MKLGNDLTEGSIIKKYTAFVIPVLFSGLLQQFYTAADTMVIGRYASETALAAVGSTSSLTALIITLFMGLSVGTNVVCAGFFGAENYDGLGKAMHTSVLMGIIIGLPLTMVGWFGAEYFLTAMGTPPNVIDQSVLYMRLYFLGTPFNLIYNFGSSVLRAVGETKKPFQILAISGIANIVLNLVCVIVFKLDVVGVALGTIVAQGISAVWIIAILGKSDSNFCLKISKLRLYKKELIKILSIGIPSGINGVLFGLSNVFVQSAINSFGNLTMAAHSITWNYMAFSNLIVAACEQGTVSFVGQNMGARKYYRVDRAVKVSLFFSCVATVLFTTVVVSFNRFFLGFFTKDVRIIEIGANMLYSAVAVYFLFAPSMVLSGALRGMGKSVLPTAINVVGICVLRIFWVIYIWPIHPTYEMIYYSFPVTWIVSGSAMAIAYFFVRKKVLAKEKLKSEGQV